jgi:hypothetical protein
MRLWCKDWITVSTVYWVLEWKTVETVRVIAWMQVTRLKPGENEIRESVSSLINVSFARGSSVCATCRSKHPFLTSRLRTLSSSSKYSHPLRPEVILSRLQSQFFKTIVAGFVD